LVQYKQERFEEIIESLKPLVANTQFEGQEISYLPISSLFGQNITQPSTEMTWFKGESLLGELEAYQYADQLSQAPARFQVQWVIRPKTEEYHDYRGYAGKISSGIFKVGDTIRVLPTGQESTISSIEKFEESKNSAEAGESVVISLATDVDISRGNSLVLASDNAAPQVKDFSAKVCWLDQQALVSGKTYLLQHGVHQTKAKISQIQNKLDVINQSIEEGIESLKLNEIGSISLRTAQPIMADHYAENPANGAFILIDEFSNSTVGVGFLN
jgi:sulfate adenylyltransferase subunit 1